MMGDKHHNYDSLVLEVCLLAIILVILRITFVIFKVTRPPSQKEPNKRKKPMKTLVVIGSGGHTTEMLHLIEGINKNNYTPRYYGIAKTDTNSAKKVDALEHSLKTEKDSYKIILIPRSRNVMQSYFSSIWTTIYAFLYSIPIILRIRPDLILCNGPGTCIPICIASFALHCTFIVHTKIVFVESFCRTKSLSLSGKILLYFADHVLVQWPFLKRKYPRVEYIGQLV